MSRYVVTELEGYADHDRYPGISVQVLDTAYNYRIVARWRSEDYRAAASLSSREQVRQRASRVCDELNGVEAKPRTQTGSHVCPSCGGPKSYHAKRCNPCHSLILRHGTHSMYVNARCRCQACTEAHTIAIRKYRASR